MLLHVTSSIAYNDIRHIQRACAPALKRRRAEDHGMLERDFPDLKPQLYLWSSACHYMFVCEKYQWSAFNVLSYYQHVRYISVMFTS